MKKNEQSSFRKNKILSTLGISYFLLGFIFAIFYAIYYKWVALAFLSPGFYSVMISWPFQAIGLIKDLATYGLAGKQPL